MVNKSEKIDVTTWIIKIGSFFMSIAIMVSSLFLNQAWNRISNVEDSVHELQIATATMQGNRFSSKDWTDAKTILDAERLAMDRRVIRLEESLPIIKDTLIEIKQKIEKNHE